MRLEFSGRKFKPGGNTGVEITDVSHVELEPDEQITFTRGAADYDLVAKDWGYFVTPSIDGRLRSFGYHTALVTAKDGRHYVVIVHEPQMNVFLAYIKAEEYGEPLWLSDRSVLDRIIPGQLRR